MRGKGVNVGVAMENGWLHAIGSKGIVASIYFFA
jgi:hypothetical protein